MRLVVDASVAIKWLIGEADSDVARCLAASDDELHAPSLMACEIANALWHKARLGEVERGDVGPMLALTPDMPVRWGDDDAVSADAARLALALDHPVYDCVYLALAYRIGAVVITADLRFANVLASTEHGGAVVTLADYARTQ